MHKYFFKHNILTERRELIRGSGLFIQTLSNNSSDMQTLKQTIQSLYNLIVLAKEKTTDGNQIDALCKIELLVSNLYYSFFASPLELPENSSSSLSFRQLIAEAIESSKNLIEQINIPEENRSALIINLDLQSLYNSLPAQNGSPSNQNSQQNQNQPNNQNNQQNQNNQNNQNSSNSQRF